MFDPSTLSWTCLVCGDTRPDPAISVAQHPVERHGETIPGAVYRLRYCNDRPDCTAAALAHGPLKIGEPNPDRRFMQVYEILD